MNVIMMPALSQLITAQQAWYIPSNIIALVVLKLPSVLNSYADRFGGNFPLCVYFILTVYSLATRAREVH